jgi:hypothetical protein
MNRLTVRPMLSSNPSVETEHQFFSLQPTPQNRF